MNNGSALYNNGRIAITKDLIFGLSVYTENGFVPCSKLDRNDLLTIFTMLEGDPLFMWRDQLNTYYINAAEAA